MSGVAAQIARRGAGQRARALRRIVALGVDPLRDAIAEEDSAFRQQVGRNGNGTVVELQPLQVSIADMTPGVQASVR